MLDKKIISALSYFSLFFAPVITPAIIWCTTKDKEIRHHVKWALLTQATFVAGIVVMIFYFTIMYHLVPIVQIPLTFLP